MLPYNDQKSETFWIVKYYLTCLASRLRLQNSAISALWQGIFIAEKSIWHDIIELEPKIRTELCDSKMDSLFLRTVET